MSVCHRSWHIMCKQGHVALWLGVAFTTLLFLNLCCDSYLLMLSLGLEKTGSYAVCAASCNALQSVANPERSCVACILCSWYMLRLDAEICLSRYTVKAMMHWFQVMPGLWLKGRHSAGILGRRASWKGHHAASQRQLLCLRAHPEGPPKQSHHAIGSLHCCTLTADPQL